MTSIGALACDADETQVPRAQSSGPESVVIFDFDETLVSIDTGSSLISWMIRRNKLQTAFAALALPPAGPLFLVPKTRLIGISVFLWIGTAGYRRTGFDKSCGEFGDAFGEARGNGRALALVVDALESMFGRAIGSSSSAALWTRSFG